MCLKDAKYAQMLKITVIQVSLVSLQTGKVNILVIQEHASISFNCFFFHVCLSDQSSSILLTNSLLLFWRGRETCCSGYYELNGTCLGKRSSNETTHTQQIYTMKMLPSFSLIHLLIYQVIILCFLSLECFGAFGANCSLSCADASYGYQCKNTCTCAYNEVCDKYVGCIRKGGLLF